MVVAGSGGQGAQVATAEQDFVAGLEFFRGMAQILWGERRAMALERRLRQLVFINRRDATQQADRLPEGEHPPELGIVVPEESELDEIARLAEQEDNQ